MLDRVRQSLRPGGRLFVVDRGPRATDADHPHEVPLTIVAGRLRRSGFEIVSQDEHFIDRPGDDLWWLVAGRKP